MNTHLRLLLVVARLIEVVGRSILPRNILSIIRDTWITSCALIEILRLTLISVLVVLAVALEVAVEVEVQALVSTSARESAQAKMTARKVVVTAIKTLPESWLPER